MYMETELMEKKSIEIAHSGYAKLIENDEYTKRALEGILKSKTKDEKKEKKKLLGEITKDILTSDVVDIGDENITIGELLVAKAVANNMRNGELSFKDIQDMQKVTGETVESESGLTINIVTGGQDLGD